MSPAQTSQCLSLGSAGTSVKKFMLAGSRNDVFQCRWYKGVRGEGWFSPAEAIGKETQACVSFAPWLPSAVTS